MAKSFDVAYRFLAKDSFTGVSKKIRAANIATRVSFRRLKRAVKRTARSFKQDSGTFSTGFRNMASAAVAFFSVKGLLGIGSTFQDALADLSAITGAVGKDLDSLKDKTLAMAKATVTSQADVAEAIKLVASAKPDLLGNLDALTATTKQVLLLKNAAGIELADAAEITAQGLNIFGASADQASRFVNVLAAGAKLGSSEIADTGEALLIAGPAARAAGLSFEQLNAIIQTTAKGGIKASRAGTAINAILGRLQRSGIDFQKLGLQGSFEVIKKKMDSMKSSTQRAIFASKIFGEEHSKVGFALLDNVKFLGQYEKSLAGTNIAQEQADIRLGTFSAKAKKFGIIFKDAVIRTFLRLEPILSKQLTALTNFMDTIDPKQVDAFGESLILLVKAGAAIGKGFKFLLDYVFKPIGQAIGTIAGVIATLDLSGFRDFDEPAAPGKSVGNARHTSRTDINVNMNAPEGVIQSMQAVSTGSRNANVGVNMAGG